MNFSRVYRYMNLLQFHISLFQMSALGRYASLKVAINQTVSVSIVISND